MVRILHRIVKIESFKWPLASNAMCLAALCCFCCCVWGWNKKCICKHCVRYENLLFVVVACRRILLKSAVISLTWSTRLQKPWEQIMQTHVPGATNLCNNENNEKRHVNSLFYTTSCTLQIMYVLTKHFSYTRVSHNRAHFKCNSRQAQLVFFYVCENNNT